jgi:uncharacterized protein (PEP-CTERM system associated)
MCAAAAPALASDWKFRLSGATTVTATNNANLAPSGQRESDLIFTVTPIINASREGARLKVNASFAPSAYIYLNESQNSGVTNTMAALASLEAVENFFFIDARASASRQTLNPFGTQSQDLPLSNNNSTQTWNYGISPYIRGRFGATGITYLARSDNFWTNYSGVGGGAIYTMTNRVNVDSAPARIGWGLQWIGTSTQYPDSTQNLDSNIYRARITWTVDPQLQLFVTGGYQDNNYALNPSDTSGPIYGGGLNWRPTERTSVSGFYEETVFGPSYQALLSHRRPRSAWTISGNRSTTTSPQQVANQPLGNTTALLDTILQTQFPDPVQRQAEIQRILATTGLPAFLLPSQNFYAPQVYDQETWQASAAFLGVRNTVTFTVFGSRSTTVSAQVAASANDPFNFGNSFRSTGGSVAWNLRVTPLLSMNALASHIETESRQPTGSTSTTDRFVVTFTRPLSPKTQASVGARYVIFDSNVSNDYDEAAVFATLTHQF